MLSDICHLRNLQNVYEKCSSLNFNCTEYTKIVHSDFRSEIDPDNNFFNSTSKECDYFTDSQFTDKFVGHNKDFSIIHFNARSLKKKFCNIEQYLQQLNVKFDIIAVSETWFDKNTNCDFYLLNGYELFSVSRNSSRGGGVAIYVNNSLKCKKVDAKCICEEGNFECISLEIVINHNRHINISCIYRTPGSDLAYFTNTIEELFTSKNERKTFFLCGDFNVDILKYNSNILTTNFVNMLYSLGLFPLIYVIRVQH